MRRWLHACQACHRIHESAFKTPCHRLPQSGYLTGLLISSIDSLEMLLASTQVVLSRSVETTTVS
jgi:hypothetical protein